VQPAPRTATRVDCLWPNARLTAEIDGYQFHEHRSPSERDRRKHQALSAAGYRAVRITRTQLTTEPMRVLAAIVAALAVARA
jgi:very-short-patch-repair endonuclease